MKLYVARHGQTLWNAQNKICGITDIGLTEEGAAQAQRLADTIQNLNISLILTSPLKRAVETSRIVAEKGNIPIQTEPALIEQNYGIYEGAERNNPHFLANKRNFAFRYPQGESMMQVAYRVYGLIEQIRERYPDKTVLLVSHGGVCRIIRTYFRDMTNEEFVNYIPENTRLEEYELL